MNIAELLIKDFDTKLYRYFNSDSREKWKKAYQTAIDTIKHDEPWLTLIACYAVFGDQSRMNDVERINAFNSIIHDCGLNSSLSLDKILSIRVEEKLPEIRSYRDYLKKVFDEDNFHLYPDRREKIEKKVKSKQAAFEGNTNLDLKIIGEQEGVTKHMFIEAKFLSDISYQISYNPVRDQIIRNIDAGIDYIQGDQEIEKVSFQDFYFLLLTPKVFRPEQFGPQKQSSLNVFLPQKSRLYCYKMLEYKDYRNLKIALPHRSALSDKQWKELADNIGWIAVEDFFMNTLKFNTITNADEIEAIGRFDQERNLY